MLLNLCRNHNIIGGECRNKNCLKGRGGNDWYNIKTGKEKY